MNNLSLEIAELFMDVIPKTMQVLREEMREGRGELLTIPQFRVLASISRGMTKNIQIAQKLGVSEAAMSRMIDSLVDLKLIKKGIDTTDRRKAFLKLTPEGQKIYNKIKCDAVDRLHKKLNDISKDELKILLNGLNVLNTRMSILTSFLGK